VLTRKRRTGEGVDEDLKINLFSTGQNPAIGREIQIHKNRPGAINGIGDVETTESTHSSKTWRKGVSHGRGLRDIGDSQKSVSCPGMGGQNSEKWRGCACEKGVYRKKERRKDSLLRGGGRKGWSEGGAVLLASTSGVVVQRN